MIDETAFENAIQSWAAAVVTPAQVIIAAQAEPKPATPYVTLNINGIQTAGHDHESEPDVDDKQTTSGPRIIPVEFQSFGAGALGLLDQLKTSLEKVATTELLGTSNISFFNAGNILDITTLLETSYEKRGSLECRFAIGSSETDVVDVIETVNIEGTIKDPADDTVLVTNISIN